MLFAGDPTERYASTLAPHLDEGEGLRTVAQVFFKGDSSRVAAEVSKGAGAAGGAVGSLLTGFVRSGQEKRRRASGAGGKVGSLAREFPHASQLRPLCLAVTERRVLVFETIEFWQTTADDEPKLGQLVWQAPRGEVTGVHQGRRGLLSRPMRLHFTDGSWLGFEPVEGRDAIERLARELGAV